MSAIANLANSTRTKTAPATVTRPALHLVEGLGSGQRISRRGVTMALGLLGTVLLAQLGLSLLLIDGAYTENALAAEQIQAQREETAAQERVDSIASPQNLSQLATDLGMVPANGTPALDLGTESIVGSAEGREQLPAVKPELVPNSIVNGDRDRAENRGERGNRGESNSKPNRPAVPSEFEITAPTTR